MRSLTSYFFAPFDDPKISLDNLTAFATDSHERMIFNNPDGALTARIAATAGPVADLEEATSDDTVKLGLRKARKFAKDRFRESLAAEVGQIYGAVMARYGEDSEAMRENTEPTLCRRPLCGPLTNSRVVGSVGR